jgi:hypothetical protein
MRLNPEMWSTFRDYPPTDAEQSKLQDRNGPFARSYLDDELRLSGTLTHYSKRT